MLKRNTSTLLLASAILGITQNAQAEMPGFYAGAQLGYANNHINTTDLQSITELRPYPYPV